MAKDERVDGEESCKSSSSQHGLLDKSKPDRKADVEKANATAHLVKRERAQLHHLTGIRTLVAVMILMHHMSPQKPASSISTFVMRVDVAVEMFFMLSGFMTHYAYGDKDFATSFGSLLSFYVRRLARVCVTTQVGMLFCLFWRWFGGREVLTAANLGCLTFVRPWYNPTPDCPDSPSWFVAALLPSWILYPLVTRRIVVGLSASPRNLIMLCGVLWLFAIGPALAMIVVQGHWLTWQQVKITWFWPPAQIADFAFGAAVAALLQAQPPEKAAGMWADCIFVFVLAVLIFLPIANTPGDWTGPVFRPGHYMAWDALLARLSAPFLAAWIYCSSGVGHCVSARCCAHALLVPAGAYTLELYLFQTPIHDLFTWTKDLLSLPEQSTEVFVMYMFSLWVVCVMFVDVLAAPADKWLKGVTEGWADKSISYFLGDSSSYEAVAADPL